MKTSYIIPHSDVVKRRKIYHEPKAREPRFCEICGNQLRKYYKSDDRVCATPTLPGLSQSACQKQKQRNGMVLVVSHCGICDKVMLSPSANQKYCKRPKYIRRYFIDPRTDCEKIAQKKMEEEWRKNNKGVRKPNVQFIDNGDINPSVRNKVFEYRLCLGVLSIEGKGEHYFMSSGPYNRICPECDLASKGRSTTRYAYSVKGGFD